MTEWMALAKVKLESKDGKYDTYGKAMKEAVKARLLGFCQQNDEFAQAVAQGGDLADCMAAVSKGIKNNCIEDLKAYELAVGFYFPGAKIRCTMTIDLAGEARGEEEKDQEGGICLNLLDFL